MEYLEKIFLYSTEAPLIFTRFYFWAFFALVLFGYSFLYNKKFIRSLFLFIVSLFFYYKSSGFFFFILIFSTLTDFYIGKWIYRSPKETVRKILIGLSVFINLGLLIYFKYAYFFTDTFNEIFQSEYKVINHFALWANSATGTHFEVSQILLPVGISFFTFQTISYSLDIYRRRIEPVKSLVDFGFYVSFFPQLVAGPIVRANEFIPQLYKDYKLTKYDFGFGIFMILKGLIKKIFIGDYIAVNFIDRIFDNPMGYTGFENIMAVFGYSLQVYVDFSGYTDIAIGVALLMGFRLPMNFNAPYKALNVGEFWKRWHISLSTWLKDYLYIPMGGNKKGTLFTYISLTIIIVFVILLSGWLWLSIIFAVIAVLFFILSRLFPAIRNSINTNINLMITMLLGGLWHGASWQFVIWGGLNGLGIVVYKFWRKISPWEKFNNMGARFWKILITFTFITFTRIFFRSPSMEAAQGVMHQTWNSIELSLIPDILIGYKYVFLMMLFGFVLHWTPEKIKDRIRDWFIDSQLWVKAVIASLAIFIIYQSISADMQPFIYFQF